MKYQELKDEVKAVEKSSEQAIVEAEQAVSEYVRAQTIPLKDIFDIIEERRTAYLHSGNSRDGSLSFAGIESLLESAVARREAEALR